MWKRRRKAIDTQTVKLHVGCGGRKMDGWINLDLDAKWRPDVRVDITGGLPFADNSVDFIYSEDFIEHIDLPAGKAFVQECHRVLRPGGWFRLLTPDLSVVCQHYFSRNPMTMEWYRNAFGTRTAAEMVNEAMRMEGHTFLYDEETLSLTLREASFGVRPTGYNESSQAELANLDLRDSGFSIYLDCWKLADGETEFPAWDQASVSRLWRCFEDLVAISVDDQGLVLDSRGDDPQLIGPVVSIPWDEPLWCVIEVSAKAAREDRLQLFWRDDDEGFDDKRMAELPIECNGARQSVGFQLSSRPGKRLAQLRMDPLSQQGRVVIHSISICEFKPD